jgi:hypothetical protein
MEVTNIDPVDVEKVAEENPQSRFRILDTPILTPGTCALCMSPGGDGRQFVDFGKQLDWYGAVYFCTFCVAEAAKLIGMMPKKDLEDLSGQYLHLRDAYSFLQVTSKEEINAARLLLRNCNCSGPDADGSPTDSISVDVEPDEQGFDSTSDINESSSVEGIDDVPASSNDDEPVSKSKRTRRTSSSTE